jgi:hypothetical protein
MLARVEARNRQGTLLSMPLEIVDNGIIIAEIEGLDPTKATLVSSNFAGQDGAQYYSSKREPRNVKIKLEMESDYANMTIKAIRQRLYGFFMPKAEVQLRFVENTGSYVDIVGIVEEFDAPLFAQDPEADLSIMCFDPDFIDPAPFTKSGLSVSGSDVTMTEIPYLGSVEAGMIFTVKPNQAITSFSIVHQTPENVQYQLDFAGVSLQANDEVTISTISGSKGATLKRAGTLSSVLYAVSPTSKWLELTPAAGGKNLVRVSAPVANIPWTVQYVNRYGGL